MTPGIDRTRMARLVQDENVLLRDFVALLGQEQALLLDGDVDALMALAGQKTQLYRRLQFTADERTRLLAAARLKPDAEVMRRILEGNPAALAQWQDTLDLASEAHALNALNGRLITQRMQHNQQALAVLLAAAEQPAATYGPDGQSRPHVSGRHFGSA
ncbi:flagella synthesis protein FlgN [Cognatazoarcus halotolerans]|uniref:flagella synthesis protein FlgN n=1 Tax=Cognatazoarcus halotolerans TaxID=2686016 RepID=UPI00135845F9|nr:flagellar protein FlgN [Cognatazoarcus halotolerans]MCB1901952.1 flagellar protein FlgN [Rhodocyclaceae bacterium]MCP5310042.1 flagellar protein FlgN [Zoogloeaceae bacterium]